MATTEYSLDFRKKVIDYVKAGNSQRLTAKIFSISKTTISTWYVRYKKEGNYTAKKRPGAKPRINIDEFIEYIKSHLNATTCDIGKRFKMSAVGAHYWLKKLGYSYKKKPFPTWKRAKRSEIDTKKP